MICTECSGSGACDPCDGYGTLPDSYPNAGDGTECGTCTGDGMCTDCGGTGTTDKPHNNNDDSNDETSAAAPGKVSA